MDNPTKTAPVTTFATEAETLAHMALMFSVYGETRLTIWRTADGKWISPVALEALAAQGIIRRTCSPVRSMYVTPQFHFIP